MAFHETGSLTFPFFILVYLALTWYMLPWKREELVSIRVLLSVLKKNPPLACGVWQAVTKINKLRTDATFPWGTTLASPLHFCTCEWKITALMSHVPHGKNVWSCWTDESSHKNKTKQNPNKQQQQKKLRLISPNSARRFLSPYIYFKGGSARNCHLWAEDVETESQTA